MKQTPSATEPATLGEAVSSRISAAPVSAFSSHEEQYLRLDLKRSLQMHGRLAAGIACFGLLAAIAYTAMKWPAYIAESQLFIQPAAVQLLDQGKASGWPSDSNSYDTFIQQKIQSASNPTVLLNALHKLPAGAWPVRGGDEIAAADQLGKTFTAKRQGTSYQVTIRAQAHGSALAAQIANAVAESVVENSANEARIGNKERIAALQTERERVQKVLETDRAEQDAINAKLGIAAIGVTTPDHYDEDISHLHEELIRARADREAAAARLNAVNNPSSQALDAEADEQVAADPGLLGLKTALNQRRAILMAQMANLTPNHPQYKQDADELAHLDSSLDAATRELRTRTSGRLQRRFRTDLSRTTEIEEKINAQLARARGAAIGATPEMQRLGDLAADILRLQNRYSTIDEQVHNMMLETSIPGAAYLSAAAVAHPAYLVVMRVAVPLAIGGILLGLLAALLAHNLDHRIYIASDVERVLGCPPMVQLSDFNQISETAAEEQLFRLAALLKHAFQHKSVRNCLLIGCTPGAGTTTIAQGVKKLLTSLGQPAMFLSSEGMLAASKSLTHAESDGARERRTRSHAASSAKASARAQHPAGTDEPDADEMLCVTDAPPLAISAETEYLMRYADAAIVVVESGVTTDAQLRDTASSLQRLGVPTIGFALNRIRKDHADSSFVQSTRLLEESLRRRLSATADREEELPREIEEAPATEAFAPSKALNHAELAKTPEHTALPLEQDEASLPSPLPIPAEPFHVRRKPHETATLDTPPPLNTVRKNIFQTRPDDLRQRRQTEISQNAAIPQEENSIPQPLSAEEDTQRVSEPAPSVVPIPEYLPPSREEEEEVTEEGSSGRRLRRSSNRNMRILPSQPGQYD